MRVLLLLTALGLAGCDTFAPRDDAKCRALGAQRGTDRYGCSRNPAERLRALSVLGLRTNPQMDTQ